MMAQTASPQAGPSRPHDDAVSLTSFNPFSEEDENDQSSYTLVTSLFSRMKNSLSAPLTSASNAPTSIPNISTMPVTMTPTNAADSQRRPSLPINTGSHSSSRSSTTENRPVLNPRTSSNVAPPLVSLTPAQPEVPTFNVEYESRPPSRGGMFSSPLYESSESGLFGNSIPGFPIQDDARSIRTVGSLKRSGSVTKVIRRIRGEGLSKDYWMDDENCKECYDCKSIFTAWRRKHHCRICGQIFCSRCASHIISGSRFGAEGTVRVCTLCMAKLAKVEDEDDDDRRSVISSATSFPAHQLGSDSFRDMGNLPQSPFAASQLFGRDEPFNLYSIAETKRPISSGFSDGDTGSRPMTPQTEGDGSRSWEAQNPPPFRRGAIDDENFDKDPTASLPDPFQENSPSSAGAHTPIDFPGSVAVNGAGMTSSVQFPIGPGSPERGLDSPRPRSRLRSRFDSDFEFDSSTPFMRSRVQSRLEKNDPDMAWRMRRESMAYTQELNLTSMLYLKIMLRQMLTREDIPNIKDWEDVLSKLALKMAQELAFTTPADKPGEDMDVRRYVKIKKIPGGSPSDSEYVNGAVITKNNAYKQMARLKKNPRVMLITFPLEFSRVEGQYIHFGQIVRQEKEYLTNLASRIITLNPHIVLAEKSVSRIVIDALAAKNIVVARTVKSSAIQLISRMTAGTIFSSIDKLLSQPSVGECQQFKIQTFDHPLIPGRRKTYMRFEGCQSQYGCTIVLRGGDIATLRRVKKVTRFLTFIVRNLKLETHLWKDSILSLPQLYPDAGPLSPTAIRSGLNLSIPSFSSPSTPRLSTPTPSRFLMSRVASSTTTNSMDANDLPEEEAEQMKLSRRIDDALEPYSRTYISVSATLKFPPPYPLRRMKELDDELLHAKRSWEDEVVRREEKLGVSLGHQQQESTVTVTATVSEGRAEESDDLNAQIEALPAGQIDSVETVDPRQEEQSSYFLSPSAALSPGAHLGGMSLVASPVAEVPTTATKTEADIALECQYTLTSWKHKEFKRLWEWYLRKNADDFVVEKYQCLSVLTYTIPSTTEFGIHRACFPPKLEYMTFYGENDCSLWQFINKSVSDTLVQFLDPNAICTGKGCDQPLARHCKVFVHNESKIYVAVEQWDGQIANDSSEALSNATDKGEGFDFRANLSEIVTTWSCCRVCGAATPFIPVSQEMLRYSFAKFLELHFYPADVKLVQGAGCQHNIYQHHIRYFAYKRMTVRFQTDSIILNETLFPPFRIRVRPETQLELKNADFNRLHQRNILWYSGLVDDLRLISIDASTGDEESDASLLADINQLINRAEEEKQDITNMINRVYNESISTDTLALNQVRAYRQDKIVAWQQDFDRLPKPRPVEYKTSRKTASALNSVRAMWPRRPEMSGAFDQPHLASSSLSEAEEGPLQLRRVTGDSMLSSASDVSESEARASKRASTSSDKPSVESAPAEPMSASQELLSQARAKSDPESDSTIGASREEGPASENIPGDGRPSSSERRTRASKLPRRSVNSPNVADLVKRYQDYIPASGIRELAQTALASQLPISESEPEFSGPDKFDRFKARDKEKAPRQSSTSDFEHGYAANIAPKYLTHSRRNLGHGSRIPGPKATVAESSRSSRLPSPEKRVISQKFSNLRQGASSPPPGLFVGPPPGKGGRSKLAGRQRDKGPPRTVVNTGNKSTFRRASGTQAGKVSSMAKHFERLGRDADRSNKARFNVIRSRKVRPVANSRAKVEVLDSVRDAIRDEEYGSSSSSSEADDEGDGAEPSEQPISSSQEFQHPAGLINEGQTIKTAPPDKTSFDESSQLVVSRTPEQTLEVPTRTIPGPISLPPSPFLSSRLDQTLSDTPLPDLDLGPSNDRHSIFKAISGFWLQPPPSRFISEAEDPLVDPEHIFRDSAMVVRTDEPTSIIALALNSPQYRDMLAKSRAEKRTVREARVTEGGEAFMPDDQSVSESNSTWGVVNVDGSEVADPTEDLRVPSSKLPWAISFESGGLTISCTVLYPEQFDALRRTYDCEKSMIESLARCVKWNASGGKSGSAFLKTKDDRFIAKELSRPELQTMETFAPAYFDYMLSAVSADRPTLLAKVFGCYKISWRKTSTEKNARSKPLQMNLLVMENLFYDKRFSKIYDLKGSTRNRHVQSTGRENEVLLDENLVQNAHLAPFYVREHSKRILRGALYNDSKFLADINVMDYSLVCGVDSQNNELVLGIVDYIRTYTWDKKLESWVKESAFLGASGKGEPTIVTPKQYRQRFLTAMERYFPLIPDRWMKQRDTPDEDSTCHNELWPDW